MPPTDTQSPAPPRPIQRLEACSVAQVRRVAAMLDIDPDEISPGAPLPRGWQFVLMAADTRRSALRSDGFPGLGVPMPELGLPRLMLGSRTVAFHGDIPIGAQVLRTSAVRSVRHKASAAGPMAVVEIAHTLRVEGGGEGQVEPDSDPAIVETQTYLLLSSQRAQAEGTPIPAPVPEPTSIAPPASAAHRRTVVPDETLLFQYSALGFNSHRIHLDRAHAREREGFPDLVVNGGLATLLLTEFLRRDLGVQPRALSARHVAPLFCNRPVTLAADRLGSGWQLRAFDDQHRLAVEMTVEVAS